MSSSAFHKAETTRSLCRFSASSDQLTLLLSLASQDRTRCALRGRRVLLKATGTKWWC